MRVLAVDPGLTRCGLAAVEGRAGGPLTLLEAGVAGSAPELELGRRLLAVEEAVTDWLERHQPDVMAVERVFSQHNVRSAMGTAQAAGVAVLVATRAGVPVVLHTPSEVKAAVTGSGTAQKAQVGAMVARLLRLDGPPRPADAADAAALAVCHVWRGAAQARLAELNAAGGGAGAARMADAARSAEAARRTAKARLGAAVSAGRRPGVRS